MCSVFTNSCLGLGCDAKTYLVWRNVINWNTIDLQYSIASVDGGQQVWTEDGRVQP